MKTQNLIEELKKAGVRARKHVRAPFGEGVFGLSIKSDHPKGTVLVTQGNAEIEAYPDRKLRQCAVTVREGNRVIKRHVIRHHDHPNEPSNSIVHHLLRNAFPVQMPKETEWSIQNTRVRRIWGSDIPSYKIEGDVIATVKNSTVNHFLIGMDETRNFICPLPGQPHSVRHARQMLRPSVARKHGTKRQGEWFFVPVSKTILREIQACLNRHGISKARLGRTRHIAREALRLGKETYVRGYVTDQRVGHHKPTFLRGWHKVVKNKEGTLNVSAAQRSLRARSWD